MVVADANGHRQEALLSEVFRVPEVEAAVAVVVLYLSAVGADQGLEAEFGVLAHLQMPDRLLDKLGGHSLHHLFLVDVPKLMAVAR